MFYLIFTPLDPDPNKKLGVWIRIHMDIFGILDPDPHENLCGSETLALSPIFNCVDPDQYSEYGSEPTKLLNTDPL